MKTQSHYNRTELARAELLRELRQQGIENDAVLAAIGSVPREAFVSEAFGARAYENSALPIDCRQTISQPYTVAFMTQLLNPTPGDRVLEIGTGSGYQAAVLFNMGVRVFTIERHNELHRHAEATFERLGMDIACHCGDGTIGWSGYAPYDGIIVTAGAPDVPKALTDQLAAGGRLVIPVGDKQDQTLYRITRDADGNLSGEEFHEFRFVPLIGRQGWQG